MMDDILLKDNSVNVELISDETGESFTESPGDDKKVLCRKCHTVVADMVDRTRINNSDYHLFSNPLGIYFRVICFSRADGAVAVTEYTDEFSWFSGYRWSITLCRICYTHLGWHYKSGNGAFYGLIADRLSGV